MNRYKVEQKAYKPYVYVRAGMLACRQQDVCTDVHML